MVARFFVAVGLLFAMGAQGSAPWYDHEFVHNAVHDLEEALEKYRLAKTDSDALKAAFGDFQKSISHLHDELSDSEKQDDAVKILEGFKQTETPYKKLLVEVRLNQLRTKERTRLAWETFGIMGIYGELSFWMTPVSP